MMMMRSFIIGSAVLFLTSIITIEAFTSTNNGVASRSRLFTSAPKLTIRTATASSSSQLSAAKKKALNLPAVPNPYKKLPWNAQKEKEREERRLKQEAQKLHRELGISQDATYEEITEATDTLLMKAGDDKKKKIKIEVAKDRILQIRLNERLAGLARISQEVQAQSSFERNGKEAPADEDEDKKKRAKEWNAPVWTQGLIISPSQQQIMNNVKFWGGLNLFVFIVPNILEIIQYVAWIFVVGKLSFNGVPDDLIQGFGVSRRGPKGAHNKIAFLLGMSIFIASKVLVMALLPDVVRYRKYTGQLRFLLESIPLCAATIFLQPYKG